MGSTALNPNQNLIDIKFGKTNAVVIKAHPCEAEELEHALLKQLSKANAIYQNEPAVFDLSHWSESEITNFPVNISKIFTIAQESGMKLIEVRCAQRAYESDCEKLGLRHELRLIKNHKNDKPVQSGSSTDYETANKQEETKQTVLIDHPVRSGQRIYAQGADLIILGQVSAGAEVIADGNVHVYGALRGRALAGATGNKNSRIFSTCFVAELVSIAGFYLTFEAGHATEIKDQPISIDLTEENQSSPLRLQPINIR